MAKQRLFWGTILWILAFSSLIAPIFSWCMYRREEYFAETVGTSVALGLIVAFVVVGLLLAGAFKQLDKFINTAFILGTFAGVFYLLAPIIRDLWIILALGSASIVLFVVFRAIAKPLVQYHKEYRHEKARVQARKEAESEDAFI